MNEICFKLPNNDTQVHDIVGNVPQFGGKGSRVTEMVMSYFSTGEVLTVTYSQFQERRYFKLYSNGDQIGLICFEWIRTLIDGRFGTAEFVVKPPDPRGTYELIPNLNHICIYHLDVNEGRQNAGYGTLLLRSTMEWGLSRGCWARTFLNAAYNSHWWYHRHGFREAEKPVSTSDGWEITPPDGAVDRMIADEIVRAKKANVTPDTTSLGYDNNFSLPEWACWRWITLIRSEPLLITPLPPPEKPPVS